MRAIAVLLFASACWAQQQPEEFEVASIKPSRPGATGSNFNRRPGGGIEAINVSLKELILFAYDLREQQLAGGPAWLDKDRYDVVAKPKENDNPTGAQRSFEEEFRQVRLKMRSLLADRFQLAVHNETRQLPVYALVVAKGGPHLTPSTSESLAIHNMKGRVECKKVTMKLFAENSLTYRMGRTVVDKTGLTGEYDFDLRYAEDQAIPTGDTTLPDFLTVLREQLGLRLESQQGPIAVFVIDRAEKASAN
jgi:bla regulator protein blaR1